MGQVVTPTPQPATPQPSPTTAPTQPPLPPSPTPRPPAPPAPSPLLAFEFSRVRSVYVSGANPLQETLTTRISTTYMVRNTLGVALDFNGTVEFDLGSAVTGVSATATRGTTTTPGRRVSWDGFSLNPGESASITITTDLTPSPGSAGQTVVIIEGALATARTPTGGIVTVRGGSLTSDLVANLANGGFVTARVLGAATSLGVPGAPATGTGTPGALPRSGSGVSADHGTALGWWVVLALGLTVLALAWGRWSQRPN